MTTPTLEQEIEAQTTGKPVPTGESAAPATQNNEGTDGANGEQGGNPAEISPRKAGQIRKQQEDEARQARVVASGVALALQQMGITSPAAPVAAPAAAPAAPALPDYLDGIDPEARTQWAESLRVMGSVAKNTEERAYERAVRAVKAEFAPQIAELRTNLDKASSSLRSGVASSFSAANQSVQKAQSMDGWDDFLASEDESGMPRSSAYQYWMTSDPAKAAKILGGYADRFLEANKSTTPSGFSHMATPATTTAAAVAPGPGTKTVSAAAINKLIADEMAKPNPDKERLAGFREIFDRNAAAKTLVA